MTREEARREGYLTEEDIEKETKVTKEGLKELVDEGEITPIEFEGEWYYSVKEVREIQKHKQNLTNNTRMTREY